MINKTRRKSVWCCKTPLHVANHVGEREGSRIHCGIFNGGHDYQIPSFVRCPRCGKAFKPRVRECADQNCWHIDIPPHKALVKQAV